MPRFGDVGALATGAVSGVVAFTFRGRLRVCPEGGLRVSFSIDGGSSSLDTRFMTSTSTISTSTAAGPRLRSEDRVAREDATILPSSVSEACARLEPLAARVVLTRGGEIFGERVVIITSTARGVRARLGWDAVRSAFFS